MNRSCQIQRSLCLLLWASLVIAPAAPAQPATNPFEKEIAAFERADQSNPPPQHGILFIGSSSIRKWTSLARDFPTHKVFNRGFGGSQISDSIYFFDRIVAPYKPKVIVFYAGSNDINARKTAAQVIEDWKTFVGKVEAALPETKIAFISIDTSPSRWKQHETVIAANQAIAEFMSQDNRRTFIDTYHALLDADGRPRPELYVADRLHLNARGYAIWASIIGPYLDKVD